MPAVIAVLRFRGLDDVHIPGVAVHSIVDIVRAGSVRAGLVIGAVYLSRVALALEKTHRRYGVRFEGSPRSAQPLDRRLPDRTARSHLCCVGHGF